MFDKNTHLQVFNRINECVGHFDGKYFYPTGSVNCRVDGDEVYSLDFPAKFIGRVLKREDVFVLVGLDGEALYELRD